MRSFKTHGFVIKRKNIGEADRILTIFTKFHGKIQVKASGVRKITSRRSSHIELLNLSSFTLHSGRNLSIVTEAETVADFSQIKENLTKVGFAYHICELIDGLCAENQSHPYIFELFKNTLERLSKEEDIVGIIHEFEIELLTKLGFYNKLSVGPNFDSTSFIENILERKLKSKRMLLRFP